VLPAHDEIAAVGIVPVISERAGSELEFDSHTLPTLVPPIDAPLGLTVGKGSMYGFDDEAELVADHTEEEDNALLVDWGVA
jgi:hypothetical protein